MTEQIRNFAKQAIGKWFREAIDEGFVFSSMYYAASPELRNKYDEAIKRRGVMELAIRIFAGEQGRIEDLGGPGGGSRVHYTDLEKQKLAAVEFDCDALRKEIMEPK